MRRYVNSLGFFIATAVVLGLSIPVVATLTVLSRVREKQIGIEMAALIKEKAQTLESNLILPVWNMDRSAMQAIVQAAMLDEQVVAISVQSPDGSTLVNADAPRRENDRRIAQTTTLEIGMPGSKQIIGRLNVVASDFQMQQKLEDDKAMYGLVLICQTVVSLLLIGWVVYRRVLAPLGKITDAAERIESGRFDNQIEVRHRDEMGLLARRIVLMQNSLKSLFEEQAALLDNIPAGVLFIRHGVIEFVNRAGRQLFSPAGEDLVGQSARLILADPSPESQGGSRSGKVYTLRRVDGTTFPAELHTAVVGADLRQEQAIWVAIDVTQRLAAESRIDRLAFYDPATQLPNRSLLMDRLRHSLSTQAVYGHITAVLCIEVHNADISHAAIDSEKADAVYADCGRRLSACIAPHQTLARLGGEKFALLSDVNVLNPVGGLEFCESLSLTILETFSEQRRLASTESACSVSIGINIVDENIPAEKAVMQADLALVEARLAGRNTFRFFNPAMQEMANQRSFIETELRRAIRQKQFVVFYQAQVSHDGQVVGAEALIRWRHPDKGLISPGLFIQVAEGAGLMGEIGQIVLGQVCQDLSRWRAAGVSDDLVVAVNVSAQEFSSNTFVPRFREVLERHGIRSQRLKVELTESMMVDKIDDVIGKMQALRSSGIAISLDDFGTGYSSLSYLSSLPIDQIKIDQSFIRDMPRNKTKANIIRTIINLGDSMGLSTLAEGVETLEQRDMLQAMGCSLFQGYCYSKPLPEEEFVELLQRNLKVQPLPSSPA